MLNLLRRALKSLSFRFRHFVDRRLHRLYGWHVGQEVNALLRSVGAKRVPKLGCVKKVLVTSYSNKAIPPLVVSSQNDVINALISPSYLWAPLRSASRAMHYQFIDMILAKSFDAFEYVIILDVDCVPYSQSALDEMVSIAERGVLVGVEQVSPEHATGHYYVSPVACCISKQVFDAIGRPSAMQDLNGDVMESFTFAAERAGVKISLIRVVDVVDQKLWKFPDGRDFGIGTVYGVGDRRLFFHNFCSSTKPEAMGRDHTRVFIDFCSAALRGWA